MKCQWCGCETDTGSSHANVIECNEALKREIESLRERLAAIEPKPTPAPSKKPSR